jgi:deferrochelatase/peroxidase EfeB
VGAQSFSRRGSWEDFLMVGLISSSFTDLRHLDSSLTGTGTPLAAHDKENQKTPPIKNPLNDFVYGANSGCPVSAHTRKTNQRDPPAGGNSPPSSNARIIRNGIPYGTDYVEGTDAKRGLLFACYQSHIEQGFQHIQKNWCNNEGFPSTTGCAHPGQDPIVGQGGHREDKKPGQENPNPVVKGQLNTRTLDNDTTYKETGLYDELVTMKGGEYFFVPSFKALREKLAHPVASTH